jgi:hypothetical protein
MNSLPVAAINGPATGYINEPLSFSAGDSYAPDSSINQYNWDCNNDGVWDITSSNPSADCIYSQPYNGLVVLQVTSEDGGSAKATLPVTITTEPITATSTPSQPIATATRNGNDLTINWQNNYDQSVVVRILDNDGNILGYQSGSSNFSLANAPTDSFVLKLAAGNEAGWSDATTINIPKYVAENPVLPPVISQLISTSAAPIYNSSWVDRTSDNLSTATQNNPFLRVAGVKNTATAKKIDTTKIILYTLAGLLGLGLLFILKTDSKTAKQR